VERALGSALSQDWDGPWQVLVCDNASHDETPAVLDAMAHPRLTVRRWEDLSCMWANHNRGLQTATSSHVVFLHADDALRPHALTMFARRLARLDDPDTTVLWGRSLFRDFAPHWRRAGGTLDEPWAGAHAWIPFTFGGLCPSGMCVPRRAVLEAGGYLVCDAPVATSDMVSPAWWALQGVAFCMTSFQAVVRTSADTSNPAWWTRQHQWEASAWRAFEALAGLAQMNRMAMEAAVVVQGASLTALERYLLDQGAMTPGVARRVLQSRAGLRPLVQGDLLRLARVATRGLGSRTTAG
jgi:hypothetical protein